MRGCESNLYHELRKNLSSGIKSDRIESLQTSVGFPDLILHYGKNSAFIELKAWGGNIKYFPEVRRMQFVWMRDRSKAKVGVNGFIFAKITGTYCLYKATTVAELYAANRNKSTWVDLADWVWEDIMNWEEFLEITGLK